MTVGGVGAVRVVALAAVVGLGCVQLEPVDEGSGGGGGRGGAGGGGGDIPSSDCDGKRSCDACSACAVESVCAAAVTACRNDPGCVGLDECLSLCGADGECQGQCPLANPGGVSLHAAMLDCLRCDACALDCRGFRTCS